MSNTENDKVVSQEPSQSDQAKKNSVTKPPSVTIDNIASVSPSPSPSIIQQLIPVVSEKMATAGIALSPSTIMQVLRFAMEAVEGTPVKGKDQRDLAINVILEMTSNMDIPEEHKFLIKNLVDGGIVADTIELIVDATRGNLDINKATKVAKGCFARCFGVFCRPSAPKQPKQPKPAKKGKGKKLPALSIPPDSPSDNNSASVKIPSELNFPALSSNLPDSVIANESIDKKEGTIV